MSKCTIFNYNYRNNKIEHFPFVGVLTNKQPFLKPKQKYYLFTHFPRSNRPSLL